METIALAPAILDDNLLEENELLELQPPFLFLLEDTIPSIKQELSEIIAENNTGIENKVKKAVIQEDEEQEEYVKNITYESENSYIQKNPYAPKKDYERIENLKPTEEEKEKSFLWK